MPFVIQKDGKHISWTHLLDLYDKAHFASGLSLVKKLKREHLHLNSYSRMRVNLAGQVGYLRSNYNNDIIMFIV